MSIRYPVVILLALCLFQIPATAGVDAGWIQTGLYFDVDGPPFHFELSGHTRFSAHLYSAGVDVIGWEESDLTTYWLAYGRSTASRHLDFSISGGLSLNRYQYSACGDEEYYNPGGTGPLKAGLIIKLESLLHFRHVLGAGIVITLNWNEYTHRGPYESPVNLKFLIALGNWD